MAYSIGNVSGCHINPAVSIAVFIRQGISAGELCLYIIAQVIGAFAGTGLLHVIFKYGQVVDMTGGYGANGLAGVNGSVLAGLLVEIFLTFFFVICILGVTSENQKHGSFGGLVIGLALTFVHIFGIGITGTSVNPARSIAPAVFASVAGNPAPLSQLWVFIVGPIIGAILAAVIYTAIEIE
jgi:aquaporin Z